MPAPIVLITRPRILGYAAIIRTRITDRRTELSRRELAAWVASHIVPHEADLRARLSRMAVPEQEIGDIVQDAYVNIARLDSVAHIRNGRAYFFTTARMALLQRIRRERIVRIDSMNALSLADDDPDPERQASARLELERVRRLIAGLPERCRTIFEMRRIMGVPQRTIAERLNIPEHTVEAQAVRGLKLILQAIASEDTATDKRLATRTPLKDRRETR